MQKVISSQHKIRIQDCDPFQHLTNSKYLDYFLNAREDHIKDAYGLDIFAELNTTGLSWVVGTSQIMYVQPCMINEMVIIESKMIKYSAKSLQVEMLMWNSDRTKLKAILWTKLVYYNTKTGKSAQHSKELLSLFQQIVDDVPQETFKERTKFLLSGAKWEELKGR